MTCRARSALAVFASLCSHRVRGATPEPRLFTAAFAGTDHRCLGWRLLPGVSVTITSVDRNTSDTRRDQ